MSHLVWVNKFQDSSSLSNCKEEKDIFRQIRARALIAGHKTSRSKRLIKRTPFNLSWTRKNDKENTSDRYQTREDNSEDHLSANAIRNGYLNGIPDPFSAYPIKLDLPTLELLWYFQHIWTQCAFKIPGCVGYGQPIETSEVKAMIQHYLTSSTRCYSLLAACAARMHYIHRHDEARSGGDKAADSYAANGLLGLRCRMQGREFLSEEDASDSLFLAAYEIFSMNEEEAEKHLFAIRRLFKQDFSNTFTKRLQVNLEILVAKGGSGYRNKGLVLV